MESKSRGGLVALVLGTTANGVTNPQPHPKMPPHPLPLPHPLQHPHPKMPPHPLPKPHPLLQAHPHPQQKPKQKPQKKPKPQVKPQLQVKPLPQQPQRPQVQQGGEFKGKWDLFTGNTGVSAMHLILLPKINKVLMFDSTIWLISKIKVNGPCRPIPDRPNQQDCWAHSVLMDIENAKLQPLGLKSDTWCSSGALAVDGSLVSTGGYRAGANSVRYLGLCDNCQWREYDNVLGSERWYSTQIVLGDGRFMVFGGRNFWTYEFVPQEGQKNQQAVPFQFLKDTFEAFENNLYPFVFLNTDGSVFVFANNRSVLLEPNTNRILHEFPVLPGGSRNYPASACSAILPLILLPDDTRPVVPAEVLVCGGAPHDAFFWSNEHKPKQFSPASDECGRIDILNRNSKWRIEKMPSRRLMGDMMLLPTGDALILNGAQNGAAGWDNARDPNLIPVLYQTINPQARFRQLTQSFIPRLYHSTSALLPDGRILVAGSNTNDGYIYNSLFPTELRAEKFSPPYLDPLRANWRPQIVLEKSEAQLKYGKRFNVQVRVNGMKIDKTKVQVTIYSPPFTTHGISMNQRLIQLGITQVTPVNGDMATVNIGLSAPQNGNIAPPGYYMLFVNHGCVPGRALWVQLTK